MKKATIFIGLAVLLPYLGMAAEKTLTANSLQKAYQSEVSVLNNKIASSTNDYQRLQKALPVKITTLLSNVNSVNMTVIEIRNQIQSDQNDIASFNNDKHTLEIIYTMLINGMQ